MEEHVSQVDAFVSLTDNDELNVMSAMLAKTLGAGKVITQVAKSEYAQLVPKLGVDKVFSPLRMTARAIMSYLYRGSAPLSSILEGDLARMLQFRVGEHARGAGIPLRDLQLPAGSVVGVIQKSDRVLVADGESVIESGDSLLLFALHDAVPHVLKLFDVKGHFLGADLEF
jgi:trk system potassium uptake protein TrkA